MTGSRNEFSYRHFLSQRESNRFRGHDYGGSGWYFVTLVVEGRRPRLADEGRDGLTLTRTGLIVQDEWERLSRRFDRVRLHDYRILPDHLHGIIELEDRPSAQEQDIPRVVAAFKSATSHRDRENDRLWMRGFHDRVLRNVDEFEGASGYIRENPDEWIDEWLRRR